MNLKTQRVIASAKKSVEQLVGECRKRGPFYERNPQAVAHVSRTSKWLLNAIAGVKCARHHQRRPNETL